MDVQPTKLIRQNRFVLAYRTCSRALSTLGNTAKIINCFLCYTLNSVFVLRGDSYFFSLRGFLLGRGVMILSIFIRASVSLFRISLSAVASLELTLHATMLPNDVCMLDCFSARTVRLFPCPRLYTDHAWSAFVQFLHAAILLLNCMKCMSSIR